MSATNQDFEMWIGDDRIVDFTITDDGGAMNLTGVTDLLWTMHGRGVDVDKVNSVDSTPAVEGTPTDGVVRLTLVPADTSALAAGTYYHELRVEDSAGKFATVTTGVVTLKGGEN